MQHHVNEQNKQTRISESTIFNKQNTHAIRKVITQSGQITYYAITNAPLTLMSGVTPVQTVSNPDRSSEVITKLFMFSVLPATHKSVTKDITNNAYHISNYVKWLSDSYFIVASSKNKNKPTLLYQLFYMDPTKLIPVFISYIDPIIQPTKSYPIMQLDKDLIYISYSSMFRYHKTNDNIFDIINKPQLILSYSAIATAKYIRDWSVTKIFDLPAL